MSQEIKHLFRKKPSLELVNDILVSLRFTGLNDTRLFTKADISVEVFEESLPQLEPYYLPCKAARFLHRGLLGPQDCITILRHIVRPHGYELATVERTYNGKKQPLYQIQPIRGDMAAFDDTDLEVSFA